MLRYIYTMDFVQIYRKDDPIFNDVERDLDVFAIADKYGLDDLRDYMSNQLVLFYSTDQRPPNDDKGWSARNQEGFGNVLRKIGDMEMESARPIRRAIATFVVKREKMVLEWGVVQEVLDEGVWLGNELVLAALAETRKLRAQVEDLEETIEELNGELQEVSDEREQLEAEVENLSAMVAADDMVDYFDQMEMWFCDSDPGNCYGYEEDYVAWYERMEEQLENALNERVSQEQAACVEDLLSGVTFTLGVEGPMDPGDVEDWR
jgi:hypothetical protein